MEFVVLGWPEDEPRLRLDYRRFSYAGKFVTGRTGIAVVRGDPAADAADSPATDVHTDGDSDSNVDSDSDVDSDAEGVAHGEDLPPLPDGLDKRAFAADVLAAVAFNEDRTESSALWLRYLTVRADLRGSGRRLGPRLAAFITARASDREYDRVRIAVNNVFSYHALYKAGFAYTGRETGLAELLLERPTDEPADASPTDYRRGLAAFRGRSGLSTAEGEFLDAHDDADPPELVAEVETAESESAGDSGVSNPRRSSE